MIREEDLKSIFLKMVEDAVDRALPSVVASLLPDIVRDVMFSGVGGVPARRKPRRLEDVLSSARKAAGIPRAPRAAKRASKRASKRA